MNDKPENTIFSKSEEIIANGSSVKKDTNPISMAIGYIKPMGYPNFRLIFRKDIE